jgi:type I restriction enzyme S subunit
MKHGWEYKKLGEVASYINGFAFKPEQWTVEGVPIIRIQNLNNPDAPFNHFDGIVPEKVKVTNGDLLISWSATLGTYIWEGGDAYLNQHIFKVEFDKSDIDKMYLKYAVSSKLDAMANLVHGATMKHIVKKDFDNTRIPVPPLPVQEHICSLLDNLNLVIEKKKEQIAELDNLAQSLFYDMFGDPTTNEKGWDIVEMRTLFDIGSSKRVFESQWTDEGVPFYRAREIVRLSRNEPIESPIFISEPLFKEYSTKYGIPSEGDIMVTAVGTLGVCYLVKKTDRFYFKDGNLLWFRDKGVCDTRFIKDQFTTDYVRNQIQGNANAAVVGTYTITNANKTMVVLPPLDFQKEYVRKVEAIDRQKELINQSIKDVQTLFDAKMDYYFGD